MNPVIGAALSKFFCDSKKQIPVGVHHVNGVVSVSLDAIISKEPVETYVPTVDLPLKKVLAIALQKAGVQRHNILRIIQEAAVEALKEKSQVSDYIEVTEKSLQQVSEMLRTLPKKTRDGKTVIAINEASVVSDDTVTVYEPK